MAKTIKFNLICDNYPVRTIEDLQEHFSLEDIYGYYENQLLHKWLKVRGYDEQLKKVEAITVSNEIEVLTELVKIFEILQFEGEDLKTYQFKRRYEEKLKSVPSANDMTKYIAGYEEVIQEIVNPSSDMEVIKVGLEVIMQDYDWMFKRDYRNIFYECYDNKAWIAIASFLMNEEIREYMFEKKSGDFQDKDREEMLKACWSIGENHNVRGQLKKYYKCVTKLNTQKQWYKLESEGKKYMILHMTGGSYIKLGGAENKSPDARLKEAFFFREGPTAASEKKPEHILDFTDVNGKFPIVDGILYRSDSTMNHLYYMEV